LVRRIARRNFEELGFAVEEAADGAQALAACARSVPDCILLDWNMPQMNGIDFLRRLRQEAFGAGPAVIFCTSEDSFDHITEALDAGANEYIIKPFDGPLLESKLVQAGVL
jgi:two-component system chemotaxis response regulator CheY